MIITYTDICHLLKNYRNLDIIYSTTNHEPDISSAPQHMLFNNLKHSLKTLSELPQNGHVYYKILYHCYLSKDIKYNIYEIIGALNNEGIYFSHRSYYRKKKEAINLLCKITSVQAEKIPSDKEGIEIKIS